MIKETFADRARKITNKYKRRLGENFDKGDSLALEAMNQELSLLQQEQEEERSRMTLKKGNTGLPMHPGDTEDGSRLRPYSGLEVPYRQFYESNFPSLTNPMIGNSFTESFMYNNTQPEFEITVPQPLREPSKSVSGKSSSSASSSSIPFELAKSQYQSTKYNPNEWDKPISPREIGSNINVSKASVANVTPNTTLAGTNNIAAKAGVGSDSPFKSRVPWMGAAAGVIGNLLMNKQLDLPEYTPEDYNPAKLNPSLVNYGREREQVMSERDLANNMIQGSARGQGSQNALMENILAGQTGTQRIAGEQFGKSLENEGNVNAQIKNQAGQFNAQQAMQATQMNNQNKMYANEIKRENMMINQERKDSQIGGIMDSVTGYARDRMDASQYDNMLQMMTPDNYKATSGQDSKWRRLLQFSPDMNMKLSQTTRFKEKGGYLGNITLFGDDEYEKLMMRVNKNKKK